MNKRILYTWLIVLVMLALSLFSCSPVKRLNKLLTRHPELIQITDSVRIRDSVPVYYPGIDVDTNKALNDLLNGDSLKVNDGRVTSITYIKGDTVYQEIHEDPIYDTIYLDKVIEVPKIVYEQKNSKRKGSNRRPRDGLIRFYFLLVGFLLGIIFTLIIVLRFKERRKLAP